MIRWRRDGLEYEADQRHAEAVIEQMGIPGTRTVTSPGTVEGKEFDRLGEELLTGREATQFRSIGARINVLA